MSDDPGSIPLEIGVNRLGGAWAEGLPQAEDLARRAVTAAIGRAPRALAVAAAVELSLVLADDATLQRLNREYRDRDAPTNVLAFANGIPDAAAPAGQAAMLGDVVVAWETLCREATAQSMSLADHFCHLVVHGTLHLFGYDHQVSRDAAEMEALESAILHELGVPDPYRSGGAPPNAGVEAVGSG